MQTQKNLKREKGYFLRRTIHLSVGIIPIIYYWYDNTLASSLFLTREKIVSLIVAFIILLEAIRLLKGWKIYGQRQYESKQISAATWTAFSVGLVLLLAPKIGIHGAGLGIPLIWSLCLGDPILGEARLMRLSNLVVIIVGFISIALIWLICGIWLETPLWLTLIMAPVIIAAEWPSLAWIDDNATMLLLPLAVLLYLEPWFNAFLSLHTLQ